MTFWVPTKPRRDPIFETPDEMWERCCAYFDYVKENPLQEHKVFQFQGGIVDGELTKPRAMTITGMCVHIGCNRSTWEEYRKREGFDVVCSLVDDIIYTQKVELAAADMLNAGFISKEIGLREKIEQTGSVTHINYSPEDYKRAQKELESKLDDLD